LLSLPSQKNNYIVPLNKLAIIMRKKHSIFQLFSLFFLVASFSYAQEKTVPVFKDGEAQIVEGFKDYKEWIRHDLWVETTFNTDGE